jgi:flagellin
MDVLGSTGQVELSLSRTQMDLERNVRALASGLRVVSASDDPSGLAISTNIQTRVSGLQQGVQNVQTANNLLSTADATLANVQGILTRIHGLVIQASSDFNSNGDLQSIQSEIQSLLQEVDKIASTAKFNGIDLFDGSLATAATAFDTTPSAVSVSPFDGGTGPDVYDFTGSGQPNSGPLIFADPSHGTVMYGSPGFVSGLTEFKVTGYSTNPVDPNLGALGTPGVYVQITQYSSDPNFGGSGGATEQISVSAIPVGAGEDEGSGFALAITNAGGTANMLYFDLANLSQQDVGASMAFETFDATPSGSGKALSVNQGGGEGDDVAISLPGVSASDLGISNISVLDPGVVDWQNNPAGTSATNAAATADAEARVQHAIDAISQARARVGAQSVALQENANDASAEILNQTTAASAIRDANIGQSTSALVKDQVLAKIDVSVLSQMQIDAKLVIGLVGGASPTLAGRI